MNSPPPGSPPCLSAGRVSRPPSTPQKASKEPNRQLPTPISPTTNGKGRFMIVFDTNSIKDRLNFSEYKEITPTVSRITPSQSSISYDSKSRDTDMNNARSWLAGSTTVEQRQQRTHALVRALLHNSHKFTSASRGLRANGERDPWSDSEDEDNSDEDDDKTQPHPDSDPFATQNPTRNPLEAPDVRLLGRTPKLNDIGIENEEDLRVIQNFRNTHNVAVTSAACGQLVFPQLGPRLSPPQQATLIRKPVPFKILQSSSNSETPTRNKTVPKHRIIKPAEKVHGPTGQLMALNHLQKRKYIKRNNNKKKKAENDTDFHPDSEKGNRYGERTAALAPGRKNPTRTTSVAGKKAAKGGKGGKRGRPFGSKNKTKTVNESQKGMLDGMDLDD